MICSGYKLRELALLYFRLGTTAFGGPASHISMMEEEVVRRRGWMTREEFLDLFGIVNLIPGPNSTEMAIQIGYRVGGWPGLLIGGLVSSFQRRFSHSSSHGCTKGLAQIMPFSRR